MSEETKEQILREWKTDVNRSISWGLYCQFESSWKIIEQAFVIVPEDKEVV